MRNICNTDLQAFRRAEHEKAWNRVRNKISEGQIVSRCYKKH